MPSQCQITPLISSHFYVYPNQPQNDIFPDELMRYVINDLKHTHTHRCTSSTRIPYIFCCIKHRYNIEVDITDIDKTCKPCKAKKIRSRNSRMAKHNSDGRGGGSSDTTPPPTTTK